MNELLLRRRVASNSIEFFGAIEGLFTTSLLNDTPIAGKHHFLIAVNSLMTSWASYAASAAATNTGYIVQRSGSGNTIRFNCGTKNFWFQNTVPLYAGNIYDVVFNNGTIVVNRGISISEYATVNTYSKYTSQPTVQMGNLTVYSNVLLLQYDTYNLNGNLIHSVVPCKKGGDVGVYDLVTNQFEQCGTSLVNAPDGIFTYFGFVRP